MTKFTKLSYLSIMLLAFSLLACNNRGSQSSGGGAAEQVLIALPTQAQIVERADDALEATGFRVTAIDVTRYTVANHVAGSEAPADAAIAVNVNIQLIEGPTHRGVAIDDDTIEHAIANLFTDRGFNAHNLTITVSEGVLYRLPALSVIDGAVRYALGTDNVSHTYIAINVNGAPPANGSALADAEIEVIIDVELYDTGARNLIILLNNAKAEVLSLFNSFSNVTVADITYHELGAITPPIGTIPPTGVTPPVGTVPPAEVTPPIGTVPPTPPIGTIPPDAGALIDGFLNGDTFVAAGRHTMQLSSNNLIINRWNANAGEYGGGNNTTTVWSLNYAADGRIRTGLPGGTQTDVAWGGTGLNAFMELTGVINSQGQAVLLVRVWRGEYSGAYSAGSIAASWATIDSEGIAPTLEYTMVPYNP
ncbi:MAG: hypothetical protein FWE37_04795 [Spirochaetaceae bacterium]|nr:hypothetical protein [Spirochaetaceae bacterium]